MTHTYDISLVLLSLIVAVGASHIALQLSVRVARSAGRSALLWLAAGSLSMGFGIWTMHFVGMLALQMNMPYSYDGLLTLISLLVGVIASAFAIWVASRNTTSLARIALSGLLLGAGIATMHFTGMAAMKMDAAISYDPTKVMVSVLIAVVAATAALWIMFALVHEKARNMRLEFYRVAASVVMGIAICGMHYTGMAAAIYEPFEHATMLTEAVSNSSLAVELALTAMVILGMAQLSVVFDVRVRAAEKRGREAEKEATQFAALLDESLNEILVIDIPTLQIIKVNRGATEHLGYSKEQLESMSPVDITPGLTEDALCDRLEGLAMQERHITVYESVHRRSDGSTYPVEITLQLTNILGRPVALAIVSDITQRKLLEDQLGQAQKLESIGQLAAGIAHEINTPAQYVGDNTRFVKESMPEIMELIGAFQRLVSANVDGSVTPELLQQSAALIESVDPDYLLEEMPAAIDQSIDGIERITKIVRAMKEFSHPGSKNQEMVDINKVVDSTITVASNEWKYVADVVTDLDESIPPVPCMPQEISQVILNLVVNGAHAIAENLEDGSSDKGTITVKTAYRPDSAEIQITDTGGGIPDHVRDHVFDPFFTTKEVGKGTGQGLTMAYKTIVNGHNGSLTFETIMGEGTTFTISLPIEVATEEPASEVA